MLHNQTKKQIRKSGTSSIIAGLIISLGAFGFLYWDYREQVKFYNVWERGTGLDFKTGKVDPNYKPPPFKFRYERMAFLPHILAFGGVSLMMILVGLSDLRKSQKMLETDEMRVRDAKQEAKENTPEAKRYARDMLILRLAPFAVLVPVPFIAMYGFGAAVFAVYLIFVAVVVGGLYVYLPRQNKTQLTQIAEANPTNQYTPPSSESAVFRSPETRSEVQTAAKILLGLGVIFCLVAGFGIILRMNGEAQGIILTIIFGGVAMLLFAVGAYNIYYTQRMEHHPFMAKALAHPGITVFAFMFAISAIVFGGIGLMIYLK